MPTVGFETTTPAGERPQTYALDRAAIGTGVSTFKLLFKGSVIVLRADTVRRVKRGPLYSRYCNLRSRVPLSAPTKLSSILNTEELKKSNPSRSGTNRCCGGVRFYSG